MTGKDYLGPLTDDFAERGRELEMLVTCALIYCGGGSSVLNTELIIANSSRMHAWPAGHGSALQSSISARVESPGALT